MLKRLTLTAILTTLCIASTQSFAAGEGWTEDYAAAKTQAAEQNKDLLLDFTGSDWCGWCIKLVEEVFSKDEFKTYADDHFVLVELDFPRDKSKISDETQAQNTKLQQQFGVRGFPTIILTDEEGRPYAKTGYQRGGPEAYVAHLEKLKSIRTQRDEHLAAAKDAEGIEKAKHLHAAMQAVGDDMATQHYKSIVDKIVELDAENEAGLKKHYQQIETAKLQRQTIEKAMRSAQGDPQGTIDTLEELAAAEDTLTPIKQEALALKSRIQLVLIKDKAAAKQTLIEAIEIDADSEMSKMLKQALEQVFSDDA